MKKKRKTTRRQKLLRLGKDLTHNTDGLHKLIYEMGWFDLLPHSAALYSVAMHVTHDAGYPWTDPRTGLTYPVPKRSPQQQPDHRKDRQRDQAAVRHQGPPARRR